MADTATHIPRLKERYEREIKPLLAEHCYSCHSRLKQKGDLRLDAGALIHKGGSDGPAVIAGKSDESEMIKRIKDSQLVVYEKARHNVYDYMPDRCVADILKFLGRRFPVLSENPSSA